MGSIPREGSSGDEQGADQGADQGQQAPPTQGTDQQPVTQGNYTLLKFCNCLYISKTRMMWWKIFYKSCAAIFSPLYYNNNSTYNILTTKHVYFEYFMFAQDLIFLYFLVWKVFPLGYVVHFTFIFFSVVQVMWASRVHLHRKWQKVRWVQQKVRWVQQKEYREEGREISLTLPGFCPILITSKELSRLEYYFCFEKN